MKTVSLLSKREIAKVPRLRRPALRLWLRQGEGFGGQGTAEKPVNPEAEQARYGTGKTEIERMFTRSQSMLPN